MDSTLWNRLLETSRNHGGDLLLVPGSPPLVRTGDDWRALMLPPLYPADVQAHATDCLDGAGTLSDDGYTYRDFPYARGTDTLDFRARAFAYPNTSVLLVSRLPDPDVRLDPRVQSPN
jgi:hypothetical protein